MAKKTRKTKEAKAKINGKEVPVVVYEPDEEGDSLLTNPQVRETALFMTGLGFAVYKGLRTLCGYIPNPTGQRLKRALPWAGLSIGAFLAAPYCGRAKNIVRIGGGGLATKAIIEYFKGKEPPQEK